MDYTQSSLFGKMYREPSYQIMGTTFKPCLKKSQKPIFQCLNLDDGPKPEWLEVKEWASHGEHSTPSIGECPKDEKEFSLSQVLESGGGRAQVLFEEGGVPGDSAESKGTQNNTSNCFQDGDNHAGRGKVVATYSRLSYRTVSRDEIGACLRASGGINGGGSENLVMEEGAKVRKLTPLECERLQGLPDNFTLVEGGSDGARYKAIGNGMAQPCADFIISKVVEAFKKTDS